MNPKDEKAVYKETCSICDSPRFVGKGSVAKESVEPDGTRRPVCDWCATFLPSAYSPVSGSVHIVETVIQ